MLSFSLLAPRLLRGHLLLATLILTLDFHFQTSLGIMGPRLDAVELILEDNFDDQDLTTNNRGLGSGWNVGNNKSIALEQDGVAEISINKEHKSVRLQSKDADEFHFWGDSGVTVIWTLKETKIRTPHKFGVWAAFHWNLGVISANASNTGWNHIGGNEKGAFVLTMARNSGIDNSYEEYSPNSGQVDKVTVKAN